MAAVSTQRKRLAQIQRQAQVELALRRLDRLAQLEREYGAQLNDAGLRLLRASTFSAYCDCRALGLTDRANQLLRAMPPPESIARDGLLDLQPAELAR
jgi:hypothetical protein